MPKNFVCRGYNYLYFVSVVQNKYRESWSWCNYPWTCPRYNVICKSNYLKKGVVRTSTWPLPPEWPWLLSYGPKNYAAHRLNVWDNLWQIYSNPILSNKLVVQTLILPLPRCALDILATNRTQYATHRFNVQMNYGRCFANLITSNKVLVLT